MQIVSSNRQMIGSNKRLHPEIRKRMVLLRLAEPIPYFLAWEFLRIKLNRSSLERGEPDRMFDVSPSRDEAPRCERCGRDLDSLGGTSATCRNSRCQRFGVMVELGKPRGVVNVVVPRDRIDDAGRIDMLALCLDREYDEQALASIYRTAGMLCDMMGWKLKT